MNHRITRLAALICTTLLHARPASAAVEADYTGWWEAASLGGATIRASFLAPCLGTLGLLAIPLAVGIAVGGICLLSRAVSSR